MNKNIKKVEKETRRLMEGISDLIKKKRGSHGEYKFKSKSKKQVRKIKRTCVHWMVHKGKILPAVISDSTRSGYWRCQICGRRFPIAPLPYNKDDIVKKLNTGVTDSNQLVDRDDPRVLNMYNNSYEGISERMLEIVDQMQFWGVRLGGDAEDTKMFLKLKELIPRFEKAAKQIKKVMKSKEDLDKKNKNQDATARFDNFAGFNYRT